MGNVKLHRLSAQRVTKDCALAMMNQIALKNFTACPYYRRKEKLLDQL